MSRAQRILALLLVIQAALLGLLALRSGDRGAAEPRALLPDLAAVAPARVRIDGEEGRSVTLTREEDGWSLSDPAGYPAESAAVDELMAKLEELKVRRPVVSSDRYHATLRVADDDYVRRLRIWSDGADDPSIDLFLGSSPNFDVAHVRLAGDDPVYELRGLGTFDLRAEPPAWIDRSFLDIPADDVIGLKLSNDHGEIELSRESGSWTLLSPSIPGADGLDPAKVDTLVRSLCSIRLEQPGEPADSGGMGLDEPAAVLELRFRSGRPGDDALPLITEHGLVEPQGDLVPHPGRDGGVRIDAAKDQATAPVETLRVLVGAQVAGVGAEGRRYAARSGDRFGVVLGRFDAEKFTNQRAADLIAAADRTSALPE